MRNITLYVSDQAHRDGRAWAARHGTNLTAVVRHMLATLHRNPRAAAAFPIPVPAPRRPIRKLRRLV